MEKCPNCEMDLKKYQEKLKAEEMKKREGQTAEFENWYDVSPEKKMDYKKGAFVSFLIPTLFTLLIFFFINYSLHETARHLEDLSLSNIFFFFLYLALGISFGFSMRTSTRAFRKEKRLIEFLKNRNG